MAPKIKSPKQVFLVLTPTIPFTAEMGNEIRSPLRASRTTNFPRGGTHVVSTVAVSSVNRRFLSALSHQTRRNPARRKERDGPVGARNQLRELAERESAIFQCHNVSPGCITILIKPKSAHFSCHVVSLNPMRCQFFWYAYWYAKNRQRTFSA